MAEINAVERARTTQVTRQRLHNVQNDDAGAAPIVGRVLLEYGCKNTHPAKVWGTNCRADSQRSYYTGAQTAHQKTVTTCWGTVHTFYRHDGFSGNAPLHVNINTLSEGPAAFTFFRGA